jgi:hypothetical protein
MEGRLDEFASKKHKEREVQECEKAASPPTYEEVEEPSPDDYHFAFTL